MFAYTLFTLGYNVLIQFIPTSPKGVWRKCLYIILLLCIKPKALPQINIQCPASPKFMPHHCAHLNEILKLSQGILSYYSSNYNSVYIASQ